MRPNRLFATGAIALMTVTSIVAGCSSDSGTSNSATTQPSKAADPNGPEVNPAGDIPDDQAFVTYTPPSGDFHVDVPEGWSRTNEAGVITFTDKLNSIRMETVNAASAPTVASATKDELPAIRSKAKNFESGNVETVTRTAGKAVLITYRADSSADPVTGKVVHDDVERYEFWKNGTEAILTLSGPEGADNVDPWKIVTDSFGWQ